MQTYSPPAMQAYSPPGMPAYSPPGTQMHSPTTPQGPIFHSVLSNDQQQAVVHRLCKGLENAYSRIRELEGEVETYRQGAEAQQQTFENQQNLQVLMQHLQEQNQNQALQIDDLAWRLRQYEGSVNFVDESSMFFQQERRWS